MRVKQAIWALVAVCGLLVAGCKDDHAGASGRGGDGGGATAVVDLDRVAKDLGWLNKMQTNLETYQNQLKGELQQFQTHYDQLVQERVKSMIPPGTKEGDKYTLSSVQSQELTNYIVTARQQMQQLGQEANQLFQNYRTAWARQYREALSPIVRQVAQDRKMNVVVTKTDQVLYAEGTVDLTDGVVDAARARPPALTEVPMEHLQGPSDIRPNQAPAMPQTQPSATQPATAAPTTRP